MSKLSDKEKYEKAWLKNGFLRPRYNYDCFEKGIVASYKSWFVSMRIQTRKQVELLHSQLVRKKRVRSVLDFRDEFRGTDYKVFIQYDIKSPRKEPYNYDNPWLLGLNQYFAGQDPYKPYVGNLSSGIYHDQVLIHTKQGYLGVEYTADKTEPFNLWMPLKFDECQKYLARYGKALITLFNNDLSKIFYTLDEKGKYFIPCKLNSDASPRKVGGKKYRAMPYLLASYLGTFNEFSTNAGRNLFLMSKSDFNVLPEMNIALTPLIMKGRRVYFREIGWTGWVTPARYRINVNRADAETNISSDKYYETTLHDDLYAGHNGFSNLKDWLKDKYTPKTIGGGGSSGGGSHGGGSHNSGGGSHGGGSSGGNHNSGGGSSGGGGSLRGLKMYSDRHYRNYVGCLPHDQLVSSHEWRPSQFTIGQWYNAKKDLYIIDDGWHECVPDASSSGGGSSGGGSSGGGSSNNNEDDGDSCVELYYDFDCKKPVNRQIKFMYAVNSPYWRDINIDHMITGKKTDGTYYTDMYQVPCKFSLPSSKCGCKGKARAYEPVSFKVHKDEGKNKVQVTVEVRLIRSSAWGMCPLYHYDEPNNPVDRSDRWVHYWDKCYKVLIYEQSYWYQTFARFLAPILPIAMGVALIMIGVFANVVPALGQIISTLLISQGTAMLAKGTADFLGNSLFEDTGVGNFLRHMSEGLSTEIKGLQFATSIVSIVDGIGNIANIATNMGEKIGNDLAKEGLEDLTKSVSDDILDLALKETSEVLSLANTISSTIHQVEQSLAHPSITEDKANKKADEGDTNAVAKASLPKDEGSVDLLSV